MTKIDLQMKGTLKSKARFTILRTIPRAEESDNKHCQNKRQNMGSSSEKFSLTYLTAKPLVIMPINPDMDIRMNSENVNISARAVL